ncbi:pre-mRNA-splicing factor [Raphidocelis subcapitata]|uniref:Pre-mRNA-splicing factor SLU7 n=1 Tax=Raphidocelis subcapitata TaxID=307507 RepID=A0A2V0PDR4_9CHLO|nr:pre-mRNA-splicing factor [Raphidocelis subcapitata]|eukprot:GBF97112.1 pre-mRNA-splicing factor [Raphidocelis subcapitata]
MSFKSSDDFRRQKELDEARKAGLAPAELDEEGREINPHIPQYMTNVPWYLNQSHPTLKHQRNWKEAAEDSKQWYDRGAKVFQATKYRKGACENCGSMSHATKDCLERPRSKGARWTGKHIAADDKIEEINMPGFESKRDRWNGYDAGEYSKVVERYEKIEALHKEMKQREKVDELYGGTAAAAAGAAGGADGAAAAAGDGEGDEAKLDEAEEAAFQEVKKRVRTTAGGSTGSVRNLRIREDTAKYLLNLDVNSAYYDPKTRSMREDPQPNKAPQEKTFFGDNFVRTSGDYQAWQALNLHSMQSFDKGQDVHVQALPSYAEMLHNSFKAKKEVLGKKSAADVLEKYGSAAAKAEGDEAALLMGQTEHYVEYDRSGRVIKGQEAKARSRYEEDVLLHNHTAVWGSWWHDGAWGFACCHATTKNAYCTGKAGERAAAESAAQMVANIEARARADEEGRRREEERRAASTLDNSHLEGKSWGEDAKAELQLDKDRLAAALERQRRETKAAAETDERKRKFNSLAAEGEEGVTEEDMEAFRMVKARGDDPMAAARRGEAAAGGYDLLE